ncbi:MAG: hypothetical protein N3A66_09090, partial [Planctomycetota bacterium]|nr:hypothetical protein [Planctomycetota bacterium]
MKEDLDDLLVHGLLPEALGVEKSPDVLAQVLARLRQRRRYRLWRWAAAAAVIAIIAGLLCHAIASRQQAPPSPRAESIGMLFAAGAAPRPVQRGERLALAGEARLQYLG